MKHRRAVVVVVVVFAAVALGSWLNSRTYDRLLGAVEPVEAELYGFAVEGKVLAARKQAAQTLSDSTAVQAEFQALSGEALESVIVGRQRVRQVRLWPWDRDAMRARDLYAERMEAWRDVFGPVADGKAAGAGGAAKVGASARLACGAMADAKPLLGDFTARVNAVLEHCSD